MWQYPDANHWSRGSGGHVPPNAFLAGHEQNRTLLHVCRSEHEGDLIPGKMVVGHSAAYVSYNGQEVSKHHYEVLCGDNFAWKRTHGAEQPHPQALIAGKTSSGEPLYVGRVQMNDVHVIGKVHYSHKTCYVPYGGEERGFSEFEILIKL